MTKLILTEVVLAYTHWCTSIPPVLAIVILQQHGWQVQGLHVVTVIVSHKQFMYPTTVDPPSHTRVWYQNYGTDWWLCDVACMEMVAEEKMLCQLNQLKKAFQRKYFVFNFLLHGYSSNLSPVYQYIEHDIEEKGVGSRMCFKCLILLLQCVELGKHEFQTYF